MGRLSGKGRHKRPQVSVHSSGTGGSGLVQVVEGSNGAKARGDAWPAFHRSMVHASPLLHDFDFDNIPDILVATYDGDILFYKDTVSYVCTQTKHIPLYTERECVPYNARGQ